MQKVLKWLSNTTDKWDKWWNDFRSETRLINRIDKFYKTRKKDFVLFLKEDPKKEKCRVSVAEANIYLKNVPKLLPHIKTINHEQDAKDKINNYEEMVETKPNKAKGYITEAKQNKKLLEGQLLVLEKRGAKDPENPRPWLNKIDVTKQLIEECEMIIKGNKVVATNIERSRLSKKAKAEANKDVEITSEAVKKALTEEDNQLKQENKKLKETIKQLETKFDQANKKAKEDFEKGLKTLQTTNKDQGKEITALKRVISDANGLIKTITTKATEINTLTEDKQVLAKLKVVLNKLENLDKKTQGGK